MARFEKKLWSDRLSEYPTRRVLTDFTTRQEQIVEVARSEGTIMQEGDTFSQENMNGLENRIADAFNLLYKMAGFEEYAEDVTYIRNDYCVNDNKLYKCIIAEGTETIGEFSPASWLETSLAEAIKTLGPNDTVLSTSTTKALSANQGRLLNNKITGVSTTVSGLRDDVTGLDTGLKSLNNNGLITGLEFDGTDFFITGKSGTAAEVKKKLGSGTISVKAVVTDFELPTRTSYVAMDLDPTKMYYIAITTKGKSTFQEGYLNMNNYLYNDGSYVTSSSGYVPLKSGSKLTVGLGIVKNMTYVRGVNSSDTTLSIYVSIYELCVE